MSGLLALMGGAGGAACTNAPRHGRSVVFASGADLQSVNPLVTVHPFARQIERYVLLTTLARYDSSLTPRPYLASSWQWSADRRRLALHLYSGLRWHDGVHTTARDVAWTINTARDPRTGYPRQGELAAITRLDVSDDSTVVIAFADSQTRFPDVFTDLAIAPAHLLDTVPPERMRRAAWNQAPVGNGPFRFVLHEPNRRWVFAPNPEFPRALGGPPALDRFVVVVVDEPQTKLAALVDGELDIAGIQPAHAKFAARDASLRVLEYPMLLPYVIVFNARRAPFNDLAVRRAISESIDRQQIVAGYLYGFGRPASAPIAPGAEARVPPVSPPRLDAARRLLRGRGIAFELLTVGSGEAPLEQMLQAQLARAGCDVRIRQLELTAFLDRVYGTHEFDAAVLGVQGDLGQEYVRTITRLAGMETATVPQALQVARDSEPAAFLYYARGLQAANRRVAGIRMDVRGELPTITEWRVAQ